MRLWTAHALGLPLTGERGERERLGLLRLPAIIGWHGAAQLDASFSLAGQAGLARARGGSHELFLGQEVARGYRLRHLGDGAGIAFSRHRGLHRGEEGGRSASPVWVRWT